MSWKAVFENPTKTSSLRLRDRVSGNFIYLTLRDGVVVGAMGADPSRYVGLTEQQARHKARFSQRGDNPSRYGGVRRSDVEDQTKKLYEEAWKADPYAVEEITQAVVGRDSFAWPSLSLDQLQRMRRGLYVVVLQARGGP